jgi:lysophospholipase L1-like esterase
MRSPNAVATTELGLVATLGDSITAGTAAHRDHLWPELMMEWLSRRIPSARHRDFSVDGATSADVAHRQVPAALRDSPDLAIVICGANDVLLCPRPDMKAVSANLRLILDRLLDRLPGGRVMIATYPNFAPFLAWRQRSKARVTAGLAQLNELIRDSAASAGVVCVDLASAATEMDREGAFLSDGVHPSALGHERIAAALVNVLADRLGPREPRPYPWEQG